jgi:hypothetical protein
VPAIKHYKFYDPHIYISIILIVNFTIVKAECYSASRRGRQHGGMVSKSFSLKIRLQIKNEIKHFQATFNVHAIEFNRNQE